MRLMIVGVLASMVLAFVIPLFAAGIHWVPLRVGEGPPQAVPAWGLPFVLAAELEDDDEDKDFQSEDESLDKGRPDAQLGFTVLERKADVINDYPCSRCHEKRGPDPQIREMEDEHRKVALNHGSDRFWCLTCHGSRDKDILTSRDGSEIDYDESYRLCGECHFDRERDWANGAHGKRMGAWVSPDTIPANATELSVVDRDIIGVWDGDRHLLNCTECHDPHDPLMGPFAPSPPPPVRTGLNRPDVAPAQSEPIWSQGQHLAPVGPGSMQVR